MYFVYFLRSETQPNKIYIGQTENLAQRLRQHNEGQKGSYTNRFKPWRIEAFVLADTREIAEEVELYFKSPSGREKFEHFAKANPDYFNPLMGFFGSQPVGRKFGRSRFEVRMNDIVLLSACRTERS